MNHVISETDNGEALRPEAPTTRPAHYIVMSREWNTILAVRESKEAAVEFAAGYLLKHTDDSGILANPHASAVYVRPSNERVPL